MTETNLVTLGDSLVQKHTDDDFDLATKTGDWLARLQLMTSNSEKCKSGEFPINNYALVNSQNYTDLGASVDLAVIAWRPKAIEMGDEVITTYDTSDPEFTRISDKSVEKDSNCMYGPEFLVYIPSVKEFATFFMGSKSARREAPSVKSRLLNAATLKSHLIKTKAYSWQAPTAIACSTPFDMPEQDELEEQVYKFNNPPKETVERADDAESAATDRAR